MIRKIFAVLLWLLLWLTVAFAALDGNGVSVAHGAMLSGPALDVVQPERAPLFIPHRVVMLVAPHGRIDVRDRPCGAVARFTVQAGTLARTMELLHACDRAWFRVEIDGVGQGWVPAAVVVEPGVAGPSFANFRVSSGTMAGPTLFAAAPLTVAAEGIWLRWDFAGLRRGDMVQRVLLVGKERYPLPPVVWNGPPHGQQWANLLVHGPRVEAGIWIVWLLVNGEFVAQTEITVR